MGSVLYKVKLILNVILFTITEIRDINSPSRKKQYAMQFKAEGENKQIFLWRYLNWKWTNNMTRHQFPETSLRHFTNIFTSSNLNPKKFSREDEGRGANINLITYRISCRFWKDGEDRKWLLHYTSFSLAFTGKTVTLQEEIEEWKNL